ncbi:HSP90-like protein [Colletotrichum tofieldiae]|nr:hsp90-like protein [Colletotrichum tofieldiae]GKT70961.1 HSP90-like protein [Colletotrichum tofieldiae]GKT94130.1 hsp90-like protein [Colletotrichum tofieldiae]
MIRAFEKSSDHDGHSPIATHNGRIPIFAVSASLIEREKDKYIDAGFDGWILKPIDFKRLNTLLLGIVEDDVRATCLYAPGQWEHGGWFNLRENEGKAGDNEMAPTETPKVSSTDSPSKETTDFTPDAPS